MNIEVKNIILNSLMLILLATVVSACSKSLKPITPQIDQEAQIVVNLGGMYSHLPATKAPDHPRLPQPDSNSDKIKNLPDESTLRLIVLKGAPEGGKENGKVILFSDIHESCITKNESGEITEIGYTYVIQTSNTALGGQSLLPCTLTYDNNGNITNILPKLIPFSIPINDETKGKEFHCIAISPAKKLVREHRPESEQNDYKGLPDDTLKTTIRNQETFLSSNNNWSQTQYSTFKVPEVVSEPAVITLNPLMRTTARITVTIENGDFISSLLPGEPAIELDRVPTEPGDSWVVDEDDKKNPGDIHTNHLYNLCIGDNIASQMGNNILYNRMYVKQDNCITKVKLKEEDDTIREHIDSVITITAQTTVLPMDTRPTPMIIRLNLFVNNVPMQFQYQTGRVFEPGHSYDYKATIKLHNNEMYIATWNDVAWSTDVYPSEEN